MGLKLGDVPNEGKAWELVPAGNHRVCIVKVIDCGTHLEVPYGGGEKEPNRKVFVVFELLDEAHDPKKGPWLIANMYTADDYDKGRLAKLIAAAMKRVVDRKYLREFDIEALVGRAVMLQVEHKPGKTDPSKTFDRVGDPAAIPAFAAAMPVKPAYLPLYETFDGYAKSPCDWVPRYYGEKVEDFVKKCLEMTGQSPAAAKQPAAVQSQAAAPAPAPAADGVTVF